MSILFGTRTYLIGPMDRVKDGGVGWRRRLIPELNKLGVIVFDPTNKPTRGVGIEDDKNRERIKDLKEQGRFEDAAELVKPIRTMDLRMVDLSDFVIANLDMESHACGSYEEIFLANRQKKPILVHIEQGKENAAHWLFGALPHQHIFSTWDDLVLYLNDVAYERDTRTYKRWIFFDMKRPTDEMLKAYDGERQNV